MNHGGTLAVVIEVPIVERNCDRSRGNLLLAPLEQQNVVQTHRDVIARNQLSVFPEDFRRGHDPAECDEIPIPLIEHRLVRESDNLCLAKSTRQAAHSTADQTVLDATRVHDVLLYSLGR